MNNKSDSQPSSSVAIKSMLVLWCLTILVVILFPHQIRNFPWWFAIPVACLSFSLPPVIAIMTLLRFRRLGIAMRIFGLAPIAVLIIGTAYDFASM